MVMPAAAVDGDYQGVRRSFAQASNLCRGELSTGRLTLAGRPARLAVVGRALWDAIGPSFAHLADDGDPIPDLPGPGVEFWDRGVTGLARPAAPGDLDWVSQGEGWRITAHGGFRYLREERPMSLFWLDRVAIVATGMYETAAGLTLMERARPFLRMMTMICRSLGVLDIHAGLVASGGKGVLIVGASGRGKTTTSIDGLYGGLDYLGDDSVAIAPCGEGFTGHSLYASARVDPAGLDRWPRIRSAWLLPGPGDDKALLFPALSRAGRMVRQVPLVAIALPVVTGGPVRAVRASPREAFDALIWESRDNRRFRLQPEDFKSLAALTRTLPCYRLEVGTDPLAVAGGLAALSESATP